MIPNGFEFSGRGVPPEPDAGGKGGTGMDELEFGACHDSGMVGWFGTLAGAITGIGDSELTGGGAAPPAGNTLAAGEPLPLSAGDAFASR